VEVVRVAYSRASGDQAMKEGLSSMMGGPDLFEIRFMDSHKLIYLVWLPPRLASSKKLEIALHLDQDGESGSLAVQTALVPIENRVLDRVHAIWEEMTRQKWARKILAEYPIIQLIPTRGDAEGSAEKTE
jgi:hypothetical protein